MNYERLNKFVDKLNSVLSRAMPNRRLDLSFVEGESVFELALLNVAGKVQDRSEASFIFYIEDELITLKKISFDVDYRFQDVTFQSDFELEAKLLGIVYSLVNAYESASIYDYLSFFTNAEIESPQQWFEILLDINMIPYVRKGSNEFDMDKFTVLVSENSVSLVGIEGINDNFLISAPEDTVYILVYVLEFLANTMDIPELKLFDDDVEVEEPLDEGGESDDQGSVTTGDDLNPEDEEAPAAPKTENAPGEETAITTEPEAGPGLGEGQVSQP
jgi:hypothetical protein